MMYEKRVINHHVELNDGANLCEKEEIVMSRVGVYKVDITPPLGIDFIGYHRPSGVRSIHERIYTTAFVFEKGEQKTIIVSIDNIGMLIEDTNCIRDQIAEELNMSKEQIMVVFTHTHSGPATVSEKPLVSAYKTMLIHQSVKAAVHAHNQLRDSEVGWNVTMGEIGVNRRERSPNGTMQMGMNLDGVVDKRIGVLAIKDKDTKKYSGVIVFCTAHPNVLMSESECLSADYPGMTREILERTLECPVIIVQGAAGNVNAKYRGSMKALRSMAHVLSGHVLTMIPMIQYSPLSKLQMSSNTLSMKLKDIPDPEGIDEMARTAEAQWGVNTSKWHNACLELYKANKTQLSVNLEIQLFQLNEGSFSGIPMEPFSETALAIKDAREDELTFFGGYTNGYLGYLPIKEEYPLGGYEVLLNPVVYGPITSLWMPPVERTADQVVEIVLDLYK